VREPVYDFPHRQHGTAEMGDGLDLVTTWLDSYCRAERGFDIHLFGWRCLGEGPGVNICVSFERDPKRRVLPKPKIRREPRRLNGQENVPGEMQFAVLIDIVESANVQERPAKIPDRFAAPCLVRLKPLDRCPLALGKVLDLSPRTGGLRGLRPEDRERGLLGDVGRRLGEAAPITSDVHLVDEVVKGGAQVVVGIAEDKRKLGGQWLNFTCADAVLKAISVALQNAGPSVSVVPPEEIVFDRSVIVSRSLQFRQWLV